MDMTGVSKSTNVGCIQQSHQIASKVTQFLNYFRQSIYQMPMSKLI